ncbi:MAG: tetratricopeptide repeat protein [Breznakibacter sp.]
MHFLRFLLLVSFLLLGTLIQSQNTLVDSLIDQAVAWREKGNAELALRELDPLVVAKDASERALYELALTHMQLEHYTLAIGPAKRVLSLKGAHRVDAALVLGQCYVARGEYKRAQRLFKSLSDVALVDERIPYQCAVLYLKMGQHDAAEAEVQKAILLNRTFVDAHLLLSNIMLEKGERIKAMLPLYYYLLLDNDGENGALAGKQLIQLWKFSSGRVLGMLNRGSSKDLYHQAGQYINTISTDDSISTLQGSAAISLLSQHTTRLFGFFKEHSGDNFDFYQLVYIDFFTELHTKGYVEPMVYFISNAQWHPQVLEWIAGNGQKFNEFRVWMESR